MCPFLHSDPRNIGEIAPGRHGGDAHLDGAIARVLIPITVAVFQGAWQRGEAAKRRQIRAREAQAVIRAERAQQRGYMQSTGSGRGVISSAIRCGSRALGTSRSTPRSDRASRAWPERTRNPTAVP